MSLSTTTPLFEGVFPTNVLTYISDRTIDFTFAEQQGELTSKQLSALTDDLGQKIEHIATIRQVHEEKVVVASNADASVQEADGLITNELGLALTIRTADCLPVFLFDKKNQAIGLVHCGWKSTRLGILNDTLDAMHKAYGSEPKDLHIAFGPGIRKCHYEVGREFIDFFPEDVDKREGAYFVDLAMVNEKQLLRSGVPEEHIHDCKICTMCNDDCFSFRREGEAAGRMLSLIMIKN